VPGDGVDGGSAAIAVHPDVRFSRALDEGLSCTAATATSPHAPRGRRPLPWLTDTDTDTEAEAP
jgi:hypothetical protein